MAGISGKAALTTADDGRIVVPETKEEWDSWVSASRTRNHLLDDALLDWLRRYGADHGFTPDDELPGYDPRTSFTDVILEKGKQFEEGVLALLHGMAGVVAIGEDWQASQDLAAAEATVEAMANGAEIIAQGVLRDPEQRTYGMADLLVRSDVLAFHFKDSVPDDEAGIGAPGLGLPDHHYRVVDIKFTTLGLLKDLRTLNGDADRLPYQAQVWIYNTALGRIQGYRPDEAYLLGRAWKSSKDRGPDCFDRLGVVPMERGFGQGGETLASRTLEAIEWVRAVRAEGASWDVLPVPSRPELYPNTGHSQDDPWHTAKSHIAAELEELTLLPGVNVDKRRRAHANGIMRWSDPTASARSLGVTGNVYPVRCDGVLAANRAGTDVLLPERIVVDDASWQKPARVELFVDFETVNSIDDDFRRLPQPGGQALIFQIGCGRWRDGEWLFDQWTANRLDEPPEAQMIDAFVDRLRELAAEAGVTLDDLRLCHWSAAETSTMVSAYNSAVNRNPDKSWPDLHWFDLLSKVARPAPLTVTGAFGFGLKAIAKNMHRMDLIETSWEEGPTDGLGAMVAAWYVEHAIAETGGKLIDHELMQDVAKYNEVDCRVMGEILHWLRDQEASTR